MSDSEMRFVPRRAGPLESAVHRSGSATLSFTSPRRASMNPFRLTRWRFMNCCGHSWGHNTRPRQGADGQSTGRRDFFKAAATGALGLAAVATLKDTVSAQIRVFPPPPPAVSPIEGLIDFHCHTAPDVFGRAVDDDESARLYMERGMEGIVLKSHTALT